MNVYKIKSSFRFNYFVNTYPVIR